MKHTLDENHHRHSTGEEDHPDHHPTHLQEKRQHPAFYTGGMANFKEHFSGLLAEGKINELEESETRSLSKKRACGIHDSIDGRGGNNPKRLANSHNALRSEKPVFADRQLPLRGELC